MTKTKSGLILVTEAATLMGVSRWTIRRQLGDHIVRKLHRGRRRDYVLVDRLRNMVAAAPDDAESSPEIRELKGQIAALERSQIKIARAVGKLALKLGVRV